MVAIVESGTTPRFAPMALAADAANRAALYVLCVPAAREAAIGDLELGDELAVVEISGGLSASIPVEESKTPTQLLLRSGRNPYAGARGPAVGPVAASLVADQKRSDKREKPRWPRDVVAGSRADRLDLVEALQALASALRPASARALRSELRPWLERPELGWTVRWLLHALDHTPDGRSHPYSAAVRVPVRWLAHRMSLWLDEQGRPLPAPGIQYAADRSAQRAKTAVAVDERHAQVRGIEAERLFGDLVRDVAGSRYPKLVEVVLIRHAGGAARLMPAAAAEAVTRAVVREATGPAPSRSQVAAAVDRLMNDVNSEGGVRASLRRPRR